MRPLAIGRKNWLFLGHDNGGRRLAILYSLVESCRRNDINPWEYLRDVLVRIGTHPPDKLAELLPHNWKEARRSAHPVSAAQSPPPAAPPAPSP